MPYTIKLNGVLSDEWCVGDQITCTYENTYVDDENRRIEADFHSVKPSDWEPEPGVAYNRSFISIPKKQLTCLLH